MTADDWATVLRREPLEVARYVRSAAEHGFRTAQVTWAQMLLDGRGTARDPVAAHRWFERAASLGSADGINMVGRCHELGWGVPVDHAEAARWYEKAADRGSDWGAYNLGCMCLYGEDIDRDPAAAFAWFGRSAGLGNAKAMGMLARCHEEGWGVASDPAEARVWYARGAEAGDCWAQYNLAALLVQEGDIVGAETWLRRSLAGGTPNYLAAAGEALSALAEPALKAIGAEALALIPVGTASPRPDPQGGRLRRWFGSSTTPG